VGFEVRLPSWLGKSCLWSIVKYVHTYCFSYFWRFFSGNWSSGAQISFTDSGHGNLYFRRVICFRFLSEFYFWSDSYIRDSGGTTATPCLWQLWPWKWSVPSDWRHRNGSPRASDQTRGSPARKLTRMTVSYDLEKLPERFPWFYRTSSTTTEWAKSSYILRRLFLGKIPTFYPNLWQLRNS